VGLVLHEPFAEFAGGEFHGMGQGGGEVDVPLFGRLAPDELDSGGVTHRDLLSVSMIITRYHKRSPSSREK
jgi:hypothetical protein